jgi:hypothetical protein
MRREIVEVVVGFTFPGVAQHTTTWTVAEGPQCVSNRLCGSTVYRRGAGREYSPRADKSRAFSYGRQA